MKIKSIIASMVLFVLVGCMIPLTKEARRIQVVEYEPQGCRNLGDLKGSFGSGNSMAEDAQGARNDLLNKAAKLGATHIQLQDQNSNLFNSTFTGTAYFCVTANDIKSGVPESSQSKDPCVGNDATNCEMLAKQCDSKNGAACFSLATKRVEAGRLQEAEELVARSCKLNFKKACIARIKLKEQKQFTQARVNCLAGDGKACILIENDCARKKGEACFELGYISNEKGDSAAAEKWARLSCESGSDRGCRVYGAYQNYKVELAKVQAAERERVANANARKTQQEEQIRMQQVELLKQQAQREQQRAFQESLMLLSNMNSAPALPQTTRCETRPIYGVDGQLLRTETECN